MKITSHVNHIKKLVDCSSGKTLSWDFRPLSFILGSDTDWLGPFTLTSLCPCALRDCDVIVQLCCSRFAQSQELTTDPKGKWNCSPKTQSVFGVWGPESTGWGWGPVSWSKTPANGRRTEVETRMVTGQVPGIQGQLGFILASHPNPGLQSLNSGPDSRRDWGGLRACRSGGRVKHWCGAIETQLFLQNEKQNLRTICSGGPQVITGTESWEAPVFPQLPCTAGGSYWGWGFRRPKS